MRKITQLIQGSTEWHAHRAKCLNASEASAMMGLSSYQSRTELLKAKATGIAPEIDSAKQRLFDAGHAAEAAARPEAERIIGQDLYPITATLEISGMLLSASYDGATIGEDIVWEHKLANVALLESLSRGVIPDQYHPQLEQQLLVIGADKALFMATSSDKTAMECVWYTSNPDLRQHLIAGWHQFRADLATYTPIAPTVAAVAAPVESLPAVSVRLDGQLVVASNLPEFGAALRAFIERIPTSPSTDQQFADCESACKALKKAEDALESSETHALAQMLDVNDLRRTIADLRNLARQTRLASEKAVTARKEQVRLEIVQEGQAALREHITALNKRLGHPYMPAVLADFAGAIKGKRTIDSLRDAVSTTLANAKIEASAIADKIQFNLETLSKACEFAFLFPDSAQIVQKAADDVKFLVNSRISDHKAAKAREEEATRARIQAEEQAKAERAAREKLAAEQASADKLAREHEQLERDEIARLHKLNTTMIVDVTPVREVVLTRASNIDLSVIKPRATSAPTMSLGEISTRFGFNVTSAFLASLGFEATTVKAAKLFHAEDFTDIGKAIIEHIESVCELQAA